MSNHFQMISKLEPLFLRLENINNISNTSPKRKSLLQTNNTLVSRDDTVSIMSVLLHAADVCNATKPWKVAKKWADKINEEFLRQGDLEKKNGMNISPFCDRSINDQAQMSINFIDFIVAPLQATLVHNFPSILPAAQNLIKNRELWYQQLSLNLELKMKDSDGLTSLKYETEKRNLNQRTIRFKNTFILPTQSTPIDKYAHMQHRQSTIISTKEELKTLRTKMRRAGSTIERINTTKLRTFTLKDPTNTDPPPCPRALSISQPLDIQVEYEDENDSHSDSDSTKHVNPSSAPRRYSNSIAKKMIALDVDTSSAHCVPSVTKLRGTRSNSFDGKSEIESLRKSISSPIPDEFKQPYSPSPPLTPTATTGATSPT
jgi:hypothetical protein